MRCFGAIAAVPLAYSAANAEPPQPSGSWHCTFTEKVRCDPGEACAAVEPNTRITLSPRSELYMRCDERGCDSHRGSFSGAGDVLTAEIPGSGTFAQISSDLRVTEVASLAHSVLVSRGQCTDGAPVIGVPRLPLRPLKRRYGHTGLMSDLQTT